MWKKRHLEQRVILQYRAMKRHSYERILQCNDLKNFYTIKRRKLPSVIFVTSFNFACHRIPDWINQCTPLHIGLLMFNLWIVQGNVHKMKAGLLLHKLFIFSELERGPLNVSWRILKCFAKHCYFGSMHIEQRWTRIMLFKQRTWNSSSYRINEVLCSTL